MEEFVKGFEAVAKKYGANVGRGKLFASHLSLVEGDVVQEELYSYVKQQAFQMCQAAGFPESQSSKQARQVAMTWKQHLSPSSDNALEVAQTLYSQLESGIAALKNK